jgi:hypothetical protein
MGRVAAAGDNARMESFHSLLQNNVLDSKKWESQEELRIAIVHWIEGTYHRRRRKRSLGKMTPVEYEVAAEAVDKELLVARNYIHLSTKLTAPPSPCGHYN